MLFMNVEFKIYPPDPPLLQYTAPPLGAVLFSNLHPIILSSSLPAFQYNAPPSLCAVLFVKLQYDTRSSDPVQYSAALEFALLLLNVEYVAVQLSPIRYTALPEFFASLWLNVVVFIIPLFPLQYTAPP